MRNTVAPFHPQRFRRPRMTLSLSFLGGTGTVTGSKYLVRHSHGSLLVDCGLFQGFKYLRLRNWAPLPLEPRKLGAVLLTHAHLDHSGALPLLARQGFRGPVYCTEATRDLCEILLPDSGRIQEQDADFANRHGFSRHHPALPLYTEEDARRCLKLMRPVRFDTGIDLAPGVNASFLRAGHILGAASILLQAEGVRIGFSGDLGRFNDPLMPDPQPFAAVDHLLLESTYGDRRHPDESAQDALAAIITHTAKRGGTVIVPAFAVGRAQSVLFHLAQLKAGGRLPPLLPVFLDSPMAIDATELFLRNTSDHRLGPAELKLMDGDVRYVHSSEESKALTANPMPKVIISASGMATGGRVLHHLAHYAPDPRNSIVFTGFQAGGTRGAAMLQGAPSIKVHGREVPVRAEVRALDMLSAHADQGELLRWAAGLRQPPKTAFMVHGEPNASDTLRQLVRDRLGWNSIVPEHGAEYSLSDTAPASQASLGPPASP